MVLAAGMALSLDLIYGLPGQALREWERTLRWAVGLGAGHVSAYALTIEEGTPLATAVAGGEFRAPTDTRLTALHRTTREILGEAGYSQYEVSNFALPGRECRHNLAYWRYRPYLGLGAGAHSRLRDGDAVIARENPATAGYLAALEGDPPRDPGARMRLAPGEVLEEILLMGLRIGGGIAPSDQPAFAGRLRALRCSGFWGALIDRGLALDLEALALTADGWWLADGIAGEAARALESG
jgi:oxygen-independent coproporphyrinogen-3 oxidase